MLQLIYHFAFINMEMLIELDRSRWVELRDLYRQDWPKNVVASSILDANISCPDLSKAFNFKVYCPEGNIQNGMVATCEVRHSFKYQNLHSLYKYHYYYYSLASRCIPYIAG